MTALYCASDGAMMRERSPVSSDTQKTEGIYSIRCAREVIVSKMECSRQPYEW